MPQWGSGAKPLVRGTGDEAPKAETNLRIE